jgi:glucose-1-phosphate adenylyltransferase
VIAIDAEERVLGFAEKPAQPESIPDRPSHALGSMGIYVFSADFLYDCLREDAADRDSGHDFGHNVIPRALAAGHRIHAHRFLDSCTQPNHGEPYWRDVGTVDAYYEANLELIRIDPALDLYDQTWPIWTYQPQQPPAKFVFDDDGRRGCALDSMVSGGCVISGAEVRRSLLFTAVRVHSYARLEDAVVLPNVEIGRQARLRRVVIDQGARIPPGLTVGFDPAADRARFHVTAKGVTLITPAMLGQRRSGE